MRSSRLLSDLAKAFEFLPGIGPKSAQRLAFHMMDGNKDKSLFLSETIAKCVEGIQRCRFCRNYCESDICWICADEDRESHTICVVENPLDVEAVEEASNYNGKYFVLFGRLSPIDGYLPEDLGLNDLEKQLVNGACEELIVATSMTLEGEATAFYLKEMADRVGVKATRIAYGVPIGGELEFANPLTLSHALDGRQEY